MAHPSFPTPAELGTCVDEVRAASPLTQCMTNEVVVGFTANVLLAAGAAPAMVASVEEGPIFTTMADGLLINVGTVNEMSSPAMLATAQARAEHARSWCLDPVAVGALPQRTRLARQLLELAPTIVRGNASEIIGLAGHEGRSRGVDAVDDVDASASAAGEIAKRTHGVVAVSGPIDAVHSAEHVAPIRLANGHPLMTQVTGVGCALGALMAAYLPVARTPLLAACAASAALEVAAERAAERAGGPGSFAVELLDALARTDGEAVANSVVIRTDEADSQGEAR